MRIKSATIENCKSYGARRQLVPESDVTLLVGPNAGGKSNTMDIITIVLRRFFIGSYIINEGKDGGVPFKDIRKQDLFHPISKFLDRNLEREDDDQVIQLVVEIGASDVANVASILERRRDFEKALLAYRNKPYANLSFLDGWNKEMLTTGEEVSFTITNESIQDGEEPAQRFRQYLDFLGLFMLLARDIEGVTVSPTFLYFSPYRSATPEDLSATLAGDKYFDLLHRYLGTTSRETTSLVKLATVFYAEKRRRLETAADQEAFGPAWEQDPDVARTSQYLRRLGYEWDLKLVEPNTNTYEIALKKDGREFLISKASSGEKEILNFLFGVFALRTHGGFLAVDEPELHLHPRWQALLRDLFTELAHDTENQFLLSTHSPVFITPRTIHKMRRVVKDDNGSTHLISLTTDEKDTDARSLLHIVNSHNNERIFFADKVVLAEGPHDRIVFGELVARYREAAEIGEVVEVVEVHGKANFDRYSRFLDSFQVPYVIVADLDHGVDLCRDQLGGLVTVPEDKIDETVLKAKKSKDRATLSAVLSDALETGDLDEAKGIWQYIRSRFTRLRDDLSEDEESQVQATVARLAEEGTWILAKGEIEDYLPDGYKTIDATIELLDAPYLLGWIDGSLDAGGGQRLKDLERVTAWILKISDDEIETVRGNVIKRLREEVDKAQAYEEEIRSEPAQADERLENQHLQGRAGSS